MKDSSIAALLTGSAGSDAVLGSPMVGLWSPRVPDGSIVTPGVLLGELRQLGHRFAVVAPAGAAGRAVFSESSRDAVPVAYGELLVRLTPVSSLDETGGPLAAASPADASGALAVMAPTAGVFYRSPGIGTRPYVVAGDRVAAGQPIGLIEVMKTFNPIPYGGEGLPDEAEIVAVLVADGAEVKAGQPLVAVKRL